MSATSPPGPLVCRFVGCVLDARRANRVATVPRHAGRRRGDRNSMQACLSRLAAMAAVIAFAVLAIVATGPVASAVAVPSATAAAETCQKPPPRNDETIHITGCLTDNREKPPAPVAEVKVAVEDESGEVVGEGTSNEQGVFDIALPGTDVDNLGKSFTIKIDTDTLPENTALVDEKKTSLTT